MTEKDLKTDYHFQRMGDTGVLTENRPDGSWDTTCKPINEWIHISRIIQDSTRPPSVVSIKGGKPEGAA